MALRFSNLDRPSIRRLKPGERITEHGITVACLADGDIRYSVAVMVDGKRIHRVVGKASDGVTRTQCEDFIEKVRTEARTGRLSLPAGRKLALTFCAAADNYIKRLEDAGKNISIKQRQLRGDRLRALSRLGVRDKQSQIVEVDLVEARRQNLGMAHRGVEAEGDEQPTKGVGALDAGAHQRKTLVIAQRNETARAFLKHLQAARAPV